MTCAPLRRERADRIERFCRIGGVRWQGVRTGVRIRNRLPLLVVRMF